MHSGSWHFFIIKIVLFYFRLSCAAIFLKKTVHLLAQLPFGSKSALPDFHVNLDWDWRLQFFHTWRIQNQIEKVNKKRTVTVRRVIIFLNISRHPLLICLQCCLHQYNTLKAVALVTAAIVLLTPAKNLKKVFFGFLMVSPLFNHFLG